MVKVDGTPIEKCRNVVNDLLQSPKKTWVLFKNQTFVILQEAPSSTEMASEKATEIMKEYGPVHAGCPAGDFNIIEDKASKGWVVTGHCEDMFTYVAEGQAKNQDGMMIGLIGRGMRDQDGHKPEIVHVELAN